MFKGIVQYFGKQQLDFVKVCHQKAEGFLADQDYPTQSQGKVIWRADYMFKLLEVTIGLYSLQEEWQ